MSAHCDEENERPGRGRPQAYRRVVAAGAAVIVGGLGLQSAAVVASADSTSAAAKAPHLPKAVNAPGTWSDDEGPTGRLAAFGLAMRTKSAGLTGKRESLQFFGVSSRDGRAAWIELPGIDVDGMWLAGWFALSPDGRWIAWVRPGEPNGPGEAPSPVGWAVMDTSTRKVRNLTAPTRGQLQWTASDLVFSGDSHYLLASYDTAHGPASRGHRLVAWDVEKGTSTVLEKPGHYWLPNPGTAPNGIVWARGSEVYREDPLSRKRASYVLRGSVVTASWSPHDTSFAYISQPADLKGGPWVLHAGQSPEKARDHVVPLKVEPGELLGWRDDRHVVVGHFRKSVQVVDIETGSAVGVDLAGYGDILNTPLLAADLWQSPLGEPVAPSGTTDPRRPFHWAGGAVVAVLAAYVLLRRFRTRS